MSWIKNLRTPSPSKEPASLEATITYLRMDENLPRSVSKPEGVDASIIPVRKPPLHFYRYLYYQVGIHWTWESRLRLTDAELRKCIHVDSCEVTVLYVDGAPSGFFEVNRAKPRSTDLAYFGTMPHVHGSGLGKWFLSQAIDACWAHEPDEITVNTCTLDHPAALGLYQKLGFKPYRQATGNVRPLTHTEREVILSTN
ncbi:MAG: GNAT family N-acetyltransferase [Pseudomonadota bacterium]